ncbi:hypothetical protein GCM10027586_08270 [Kineococcus gypseus]|uniref:hypothetical protein n=1 Tax=Kineococcus gypseus TaxID=1637102 RepID=UPI003D7C8BEA
MSKKVKKQFKKLPVVCVSITDWLQAATASRWAGPFTEFSCNARGAVWPVPGRGYSRESDRLITRELTRALDGCVSAYLRLRGAGGRFYLDITRGLIVRHVDAAVVAQLRWLP